jgi:hypothetical protein
VCTVHVFDHSQRLYLSGVSRHDILYMTELKQGKKNKFKRGTKIALTCIKFKELKRRTNLALT